MKLRGKETGQWLSILPSMVNGTVLLAQECWDSLLLHHARSPANLQSYCDGCGQKFSVHHALGRERKAVLFFCNTTRYKMN
jgi:hypothetical protein